MISISYPASDAGRYPSAPWLPEAAAAHFLTGMHVPPGRIQLPSTHSHQGAPVDRQAGRLPVVLFSPGSKMDRSSDTALTENLASHGYAVVAIDHTHDSGEVGFPGGRLAVSTLPPDSTAVNTEATAVREADVRFVLNELARLNTGHNPDADHHPLPPRRALPSGGRGPRPDPRQLDQLTGTINGDRAVVIETAYIRAFFDRWLRRHHCGLLDAPSPRYPEIQFVR